MKRKTYKMLMRCILVIISLIITLLLCLLLFKNGEHNQSVFAPKKEIELKEIIEDKEDYKIKIEYPYFSSENIDKKIYDFLDTYVKKIIETKEKNSINITYQTYNIDKYLYLIFDINYSLDEDLKYKTFLIDNDGQSFANYSNLFDIDSLKTKVVNKLFNKYSSAIVNKIKESDFNNIDYLINKEEIILYFYELKTNKMSYVPSITYKIKDLKKIIKTDILIDKEYKFKKIKKDKYIAFTFDDGPSDVTPYILNVLKEYNAHVTFFSMGNRMNSYKKTILREVREGHLVASHTLSHKNLTEISNTEILNEINTTNTRFNNITDKHITLVRPPYGAYNSNVLNTVNYPLILWNIDTRDWYNLDSTKTSNTVINKAFDGGIVLMHDLYESNVEALKIALPELESRGYNFITIEEMADKFGVKLKSGKAYRYIE